MRGALWLLLVGCARTPPHAAWTGSVSVEAGWRVASPPQAPCDWQAEALVSGEALLWGEVPDRFKGPCPTGTGSRLVTVDIVGRDGPFVSTVLRARGPLPALRGSDVAPAQKVPGAEGEPSATPPPPAASTVMGKAPS